MNEFHAAPPPRAPDLLATAPLFAAQQALPQLPALTALVLTIGFEVGGALVTA